MRLRKRAPTRSNFDFSRSGTGERFDSESSLPKETTGADESQLEMIKRLELSPSDHHVLIQHCQARGILFLSTPFDMGSADMLDDLGTLLSKFPRAKLPTGRFSNTLHRRKNP